ncbi:MAG: hypothetical protein AAF694_14430 [Bacteroidota bacterium]
MNRIFLSSKKGSNGHAINGNGQINSNGHGIDLGSERQQSEKENTLLSQTEDQLVQILFDSKTILDSENGSIFYNLGKKDGAELGDLNIGVRMIESYFNYLILSEEQTKQILSKEPNGADKRAQFLKEEIEKLKTHTDEQQSDSRAGILRAEIKDLKAQIEKHRKSQYQDSLVEDFNQSSREYRDNERLFSYSLQAEGYEGKQKINKIIHKAEEIIESELDKLKNEPEINARKRSKKIKAWERIFLDLISFWVSLRKGAYDYFDSRNREASARAKDLVEEVKKGNTISTPSRFRVLSEMAFFCLILIGEIFLIYAFTKETLMMDPEDVSLPAGMRPVLYVFLFIFCLAYPLGLGMVTKFYISRATDRKKASQRIVSLLTWVAPILILSIAISNPLIVESLVSEIDIDQDQYSWIPWVKIIAYAFAFTGITVLFSTVAGILYVDMIQGYELYRNGKKHSVFQFFKKEAFIKNYEEEIDKKEQEIKLMKDELSSLQKEYQAAEGIASRDYSTWNLGLALEELREASISAYRRGFQKGVNDVLEKYKGNPEELLERYYNRKIVSHYLTLINQQL